MSMVRVGVNFGKKKFEMKTLITLTIILLAAASITVNAQEPGTASILVTDCQDDGSNVTSLSFDYEFSLNSGATPDFLAESSFSIDD